MKNKILNENELNQLSEKTKTDLYYLLLDIEEQLQYKNKEVTNTIDYLQNN